MSLRPQLQKIKALTLEAEWTPKGFYSYWIANFERPALLFFTQFVVHGLYIKA